MKHRIIIPLRDPREAKARLAASLGAADREALATKMFAHVLGVACSVVPPRQCVVLSGSDTVLGWAKSAGAHPMRDQLGCLNRALEHAAAALARTGETPIVTLFADLPWLEASDLEALLTSESDVTVAPDLADTGTNALALRRPQLISYRFGARSFAAHGAEAEAKGLSLGVVRRPGLARDVDQMPDYLAYLQDFGPPQSSWRLQSAGSAG